MNLTLWIILSALAGWLLSTNTHFGRPQNKQLDVLIAIGGGLLMAYLINYFGKATLMGIDPISEILAIIGAASTLACYRLLNSLFDHIT